MLCKVKKSLGLSQIRLLESFGQRINKFGVNFAVYDAYGGLVLLQNSGSGKSDENAAEKMERESYTQLYAPYARGCIERGKSICRLGKYNQILAAVLKSGGEIVGAVLVDLGEQKTAADDTKQAVKGHYKLAEVLNEMLELLTESFRLAAKTEEQIDMVSAELAQVYEELVVLHKLGTNMKVTESDANFLQMACDCLADIVSVEGIAILLEKAVDGERQLVLTAGLGLIDMDEHMTSVLYNRLAKEISDGKEALLDSDIDSPFKYDWPGSIKNIIAVPLFGKGRAVPPFSEKMQDGTQIIGLMVAINRIDKPDFDSTDAKLFNSVASGCAVFVENGRLFKDLKELFIGSLKALTSSIDAKDQYTRGHSERVALLSRWIADKLAEKEPLSDEQIHKIYLAGLLHDIGKMGINESVLRKKGKLTEKEFNQIRAHPAVGAGILSGIKQMRDIVPGILCHHERVDGKGYPGGLIGEQIPLIGKIVGLADSFDAMTSKRTYRNAMSVEQALAEIKKGLGTQFDEKTGKTFLGSDVYQLWELIRDGIDEIYGTADLSLAEYGVVAVETLIK